MVATNSRKIEAKITRSAPAATGPISSVASEADRNPVAYMVASISNMTSDRTAGWLRSSQRITEMPPARR